MNHAVDRQGTTLTPASTHAAAATVPNDAANELAEDLDRLAKAEQIERDRQREERLAALRALAQYD